MADEVQSTKITGDEIRGDLFVGNTNVKNELDDLGAVALKHGREIKALQRSSEKSLTFSTTSGRFWIANNICYLVIGYNEDSDIENNHSLTLEVEAEDGLAFSGKQGNFTVKAIQSGNKYNITITYHKVGSDRTSLCMF